MEEKQKREGRSEAGKDEMKRTRRGELYEKQVGLGKKEGKSQWSSVGCGSVSLCAQCQCYEAALRGL